MGTFRPSSVACILFLCFVLSSALDMSIIKYDREHGQGVPLRTEKEVMEIYESWMARHGKAYNAIGEKERRFQIFKDNLKFIDEHNAESRTYKVGLNRFADLTNEEYRAMFLGGRMQRKKALLKPKSDRYAFRSGDKLPKSVDWREKGAVAPVKDQGQCGEFSTFSRK